jgi:hypothetical protein
VRCPGEAGEELVSLHLYFAVSCDAEKCAKTEPLQLDAESIPDAMIELEKAGWKYIVKGGFACPECIAPFLSPPSE